MEDLELLDDRISDIKSLIGNKVSITTVDNRCHEGIIYVIDPVYKTIVLIDEHDESRLEFILRHAVKSFKILSQERRNEFLGSGKKETDGSEASRTKERLKKWLKHMFIGVEESDGCLVAEKYLRIEAPYGKDNCFCDNSIVLEKIRHVIDLMPPDFE